MIFLKKKKKTMECDIFFKCSEKMIFPKKSHRNMIFSLSLGMMAFFSRENMIFFLRTENERWSFSKNTWKYDVFCMFGKGYFFFLQIWNYPSVKKTKMVFSRKIHLNMTFPALRKKMIFILEKMILALSVLLRRPF